MEVKRGKMERMKDKIIELDTEFAKEIGFTSDKFEGFLWKVEKYIYISCIKSIRPKQGNLSSLFNAIREKGFGIEVPSPFPLMEFICEQKGFKKTVEYNDIHNVGNVEMWVLERMK